MKSLEFVLSSSRISNKVVNVYSLSELYKEIENNFDSKDETEMLVIEHKGRKVIFNNWTQYTCFLEKYTTITAFHFMIKDSKSDKFDRSFMYKTFLSLPDFTHDFVVSYENKQTKICCRDLNDFALGMNDICNASRSNSFKIKANGLEFVCGNIGLECHYFVAEGHINWMQFIDFTLQRSSSPGITKALFGEYLTAIQ